MYVYSCTRTDSSQTLVSYVYSCTRTGYVKELRKYESTFVLSYESTLRVQLYTYTYNGGYVYRLYTYTSTPYR
jgi:hypothetical protein